MRSVLVSAVLFLTGAGQLVAQTFVPISETRFVSVSGWAQTPPLEPVNYSSSQNPGGIFGAFNGYVTSRADAFDSNPNEYGNNNSAHARSTASQDSRITSTQFYFGSIAREWHSVPAWSTAGALSAEANSMFQVTFGVSSSLVANLTVENVFSFPAYGINTFNASLTSLQDGLVWSWIEPTDPYPYATSFVLDPTDTYTLTASLQSRSDVIDSYGLWSQIEANLNFSVSPQAVPEPTTGALLISGALAALVFRRRSKR